MNWNRFRHEDYFGLEMVSDYVDQFEDIRLIHSRRYLKRAVKSLMILSNGYHDLMQEIEGSKKLMRKHAENLTFSMKRLAEYSGMSVGKVTRIFGVSRDWYYQHRNKVICGASQLGKCFRQYPNQLTIHEVAEIEKLVTDASNFRKTMTSLYYHALNFDLLACGYSTFAKYARLLGFKGRKKKEKPKKKAGFKASRFFEWLHVDVTFVQTMKDGIQKVAFVKDNYSTSILGHASTSDSADSYFIRDLFIEVFQKYGLLSQSEDINILSDGGAENKGVFLEWINRLKKPPAVTKITACTPEFPYSNSMSESIHDTYKNEFMGGKFSYDIDGHLKDLDTFVEDYNYHRYPFRLFGLTPMDMVEKGLKPCRGRFKDKIQVAREKRVIENQNFNQCGIGVACW